MTRPCNTPHPTTADVRCERARGHRGHHDDGSGLQEPWPRTARGRTPTAAELASAVLSDLAAGLSRAATAARHGVSRQRVQAIARAADLPRGGRGGGSQTSHREGAALLARLREIAAAAGEDPGAWLAEAAWAVASVDRAAAELDHLAEHGSAPEREIAGRVLRLICGPRDPALAAQVRAVVEAAEP